MPDTRYAVHVRTSVRVVARRLYGYLKSIGAQAELAVVREPRFERRLLYEVREIGGAGNLQALNELGILSDGFRLEPGIPRRFLRQTCCRAAFLRGCFLGAGSVNDPNREAHLEFNFAHEEFARDVRDLLERFELKAGLYQRRGAYVVYLKGRDEVAGLLARIGAHESALAVAEGAVVKEVRAQANRIANCDEANVRRASRAAQQQLEAVAYLERLGLLAELPSAIRAAADLRRAHPFLGLSELAEEAGDVSRSALGHRMRRLMEAAQAAGFCFSSESESGLKSTKGGEAE